MIRGWVVLGALVAVAGAPGSSLAVAHLGGALGVSAGWQQRQDYGSGSRAAFVPEMVGLLYLPTPLPRFYLRPGLRVGYGGLDQADMPAALRVIERDLAGRAELALLRDGAVVPAFTVGTGLAYRWSTLEAGRPLSVAGHAIADRQILPSLYAQIGVGLPLAGGLLVAEPHVRYEHAFGDERLGWRFGLDLTVRLF